MKGWQASKLPAAGTIYDAFPLASGTIYDAFPLASGATSGEGRDASAVSDGWDGCDAFFNGCDAFWGAVGALGLSLPLLKFHFPVNLLLTERDHPVLFVLQRHHASCCCSSTTNSICSSTITVVGGVRARACCDVPKEVVERYTWLPPLKLTATTTSTSDSRCA